MEIVNDTVAKHLTIKDKIQQVHELVENIKGKTGYCINEFSGSSTPEKQPSESKMDYDLDLIIHALQELKDNLYIG